MKKITFTLAILLTGLQVFSQEIFFYEDFNQDDGSRGFTVQNVATGGQSTTELGKRVSDIPDAGDSSPVFTSRPANRIPNGGTIDPKTIAFKCVGSGPNINYAVESWGIITTQDLTIRESPYVTFWTEQRYANGGISTMKIMVSTDYTEGNAPNTATWTDETANITGKIATSGADAQTFVYGELDLSSYSSSTVTVAFKIESTDEATAPYSSSSRNGTFYVSDVTFKGNVTPVSNGLVTLNESAVGQTNVFKLPTPALDKTDDSNFTVKYFDRIFTTETYATRFVADQIIPTGEGIRLEVADIYGTIEISEFNYSLRNAQKEGFVSSWKIEASNDDSTWTDIGGGAFNPPHYSASGATEVVKSVDTEGTAYKYFRMVLAADFPLASNTGFIEFQQINVKVGNSTLTDGAQETANNVSVYPNPVSNLLHVNSSKQIAQVRVSDLTGKTVYQSSNGNAIDVSNFAKGVYIVQISTNDGTLNTTKVIVK